MSLNLKADRDLAITNPPHIRGHLSVKKIMWSVVVSLLPANIYTVYLYGVPVLFLIAVSLGAAIIAEFLYGVIADRPFAVLDGSAVITGLLVAMNTPREALLWLPAAGSFFAIIIVKQAFGGLGRNIFNPALSARVFMMIIAMLLPDIWPVFSPGIPQQSFFGEQLAAVKLDTFSYFNGDYVILFLLLAGALFLLIRRIITWRIPVAFIASTGVFTLTYYYLSGAPYPGDALYFHLIAGNLILGAFFMATDTVTSPVTGKGMIAFGIGCGILTSALRLWISFPEGIGFAILLMNAAVPLIDRFTRPRVFGT